MLDTCACMFNTIILFSFCFFVKNLFLLLGISSAVSTQLFTSFTYCFSCQASFTAEDGLEISSTAATLRQLSVHEEGKIKTKAGPALIIPDYLRVTNVDCSQLSFGSFGAGAFSRSFSLKPPESNLEVVPSVDDDYRIDESDSRYYSYFFVPLLFLF